MADTVMPLVAAEYQRLHDALAPLSEDTWQTLSLCEGWTIRHVVAHVTMPARYGPEEFGAELAAAQFDFGALSNRIADRDSALPVRKLLQDLSSDVLAHWTTPAGGPIGSLSHVVIHGLDVTVPLGLGSVVSDDALRLVLDNLTAGGTHRNFGTSIDHRLVADDLDWKYGSGPVLSAPAHRLVLWLAGRVEHD